jgi:atypical dual specificity phosphatase
MDLEIAKTLGCIVLRGNRVDEIAQNSPAVSSQKPKTPYHVTILTKLEIQEFNVNQKVDLEQHLKNPSDLTPPIDLGVGIQGSVAFNVLFWPQGDNLRHVYGLPRKDFHITLSPNDNHAINKGVHAITGYKALSIEQVDQIISTCSSLASSSTTREYALEVVRFIATSHISCLSEISFDKAWRLLFKFSYNAESSEFASKYLESYPNSVAALIRAAHGCEMPQQAKQAMFMFAQAAHLLPDDASATKIQCIQALVRCSENTEFGPFFLDHEAEEWKNNRTFYSTYARAFQDPEVRRLVKMEVARLMANTDSPPALPSVASNQDVFTPMQEELFRLPRFFRWLTTFRLAVMSTPRSQKDIQVLVALGITLVVTLTEEEPLPAEWFKNTPCRNLFLPVRNYKAPANG